MTGYLRDASATGLERLHAAEEAFGAVLDLLRTQHDRDGGFRGTGAVGTSDNVHGSSSSIVPQTRDRQVALHDRVARVECPGLSLSHEGHLQMNHSSKVQAEQEAASLLRRPWRIEVGARSEDQSLRIEDLPKSIINNLYESFAILVDSRLRVYANVYLRHLRSLVSKRADAMGILQMGQKLETLYDIGGQITARTVQLHLEIDEGTDVEELSPGVFQQALQLEATMDLHVSSPVGQSRITTVHHKASGFLKAHVRSEDNKFQVHLHVDTKELLSNMMDQASHIVAEIVETTNEAFCLPEPKLERGDSFFVMPPPLPRKQQLSVGLELLSEAAEAAKENSVVITPDLTAKTSNANLIPLFHLEDEQIAQQESEASVDELSSDQCAAIIDDVFGGWDDSLLQGPRPKKIKTTH